MLHAQVCLHGLSIPAFFLLATAVIAGFPSAAGYAQSPERIRLEPPDTTRGLPFMKALAVKASVREFSARELSLRDLSDLLWAANGMNRPGERKYTASSAMNAHDVDVYVFLKTGVYLYDADRHVLNRVLEGDHRGEIVQLRPPRPRDKEETTPPGGTRSAETRLQTNVGPAGAPVHLVLVSSTSRFPGGTPQLKYEWGAIDAGIVSQNISLFCAATGLGTVPRAAIDKAKIRELLKLDETQHVFLDHPVGYKE
ncbi:MAG: SagB/ThcOx family dehydrogenase [Bacteroidota bacterium]|nr:SagB/ThcOx family dehydrogenase [Bacteroidota bacterium]